MDIRGLAYIRIEATDPKTWEEFGTNILGMMVAPEMSQGDNLYLKMDEYSYRYCIVPGTENRFVCAGWEVPGIEAFAQAKEDLKNAGVPFTPGTQAEADERNVREFIHFEDPAGHRVELEFWISGVKF